MKQLFYFGCMNGPGHGFHTITNPIYGPHIAKQLGVNTRLFDYFDGLYTAPKANECEYNVTTIGRLLIVAWPDYSIDHRPGSNSAFIGHNYSTVEELLADAADLFQRVVKRQKEVLTEYRWA